MKIYVKTQTGTRVFIEVESSHFIYNVKTKIQAKKRIPRGEQVLMFDERSLDDGRPLTDYGIREKSTLHLVREEISILVFCSGPSPVHFVDLENNEALQRIAFTYGRGQRWCRVMRGLNIEGNCTQSSCAAYGKRIVCQMHFCAFDIVTKTPTCQECRCTIEDSTCGFTDCEWMYSGRKRGSAVEITSEWQVAGDEYERFREAGNMADWEVLVITARRNPNPRPECVMCLRNIRWEQHRESLDCGCRFHRDCVTSWRRYETHCPTCRVEISRPNDSAQATVSVEGGGIRPNISMIGTSQRQ